MNTPDWLDLAWKIATLVGTVAVAVVGWFLKFQADTMREVKRELKESREANSVLRDDIADIRVVLPTNYLNKQDFLAMENNIFKALRRLEDKLDRMRGHHPPFEDTTR